MIYQTFFRRKADHKEVSILWEEIQDESIKCKHCGEFLNGRKATSPALPMKSCRSFANDLIERPRLLPSAGIAPPQESIGSLPVPGNSRG